MSKKIQHTLEKYLNTKISAFRNKNWVKLPPIAEMAREIGVSYVSMHKIVRSFVKRGELLAKPGRGIEIISDVHSHAPEQNRISDTQKTWERVAEEIKKNIIAGKYQYSVPLPSISEMQSEYHVCFATMVKAIQSLKHVGILEQKKRRYFLPEPAKNISSGAVVLICRNIGIASYVQDMIRKWKMSFSIHAIGLVHVPIWYNNKTLISFDTWEKRFIETCGNKTVLGFILWDYSIYGYPILPFISGLKKYSCPLAILHEPGYKLEKRRIYHEYPVRFFVNQLNFDAGKSVGAFCAQKHVKNMVYIAPHDKAGWSVERLEGIRESLLLHQNQTPIHEFVSGKTLRATGVRSGSLELVSSVKALNETRQISHANAFTGGPIGALLANSFTRIVNILHKSSEMFETVNEIASLQGPLAIIGSNDERLLITYLLLQQNHPEALKDCILAAFDDRDIAFQYDFTSYNFNADAVVRAITDFIIHPSAPLFKKTDEGYIKIRGYLNER